MTCKSPRLSMSKNELPSCPSITCPFIHFVIHSSELARNLQVLLNSSFYFLTHSFMHQNNLNVSGTLHQFSSVHWLSHVRLLATRGLQHARNFTYKPLFSISNDSVCRAYYLHCIDDSLDNLCKFLIRDKK